MQLPAFNGGFSTFFAGTVVFGGTRCDGTVDGESCDGDAVVEVRLLDESDQRIETVELRRESGGGYRSVGAGSYGSVGDELWVYSDFGEIGRGATHHEKAGKTRNEWPQPGHRPTTR